MSSSTPTLEDAEAAARAVAVDGVSKVMLFGSVLDGTADDGSDIDLIAVFNDLGDYSDRMGIMLQLRQMGRGASGHPVDVHVTDWPEWVHRIRMPTTFERAIVDEAVTVFEEPVGEINWDKEIGMPTTTIKEAVHMFENSHKQLVHLRSELEKYAEQRYYGPHNTQLDSVIDFQMLLVSICERSDMAIEVLLKTLVFLGGEKPPKRTHYHDELIPDLPDAYRQDVAGLLVPIQKCFKGSLNHTIPRSELQATMPCWRELGTYGYLAKLLPQLCATPDVAMTYADVVSELAGYTANHVQTECRARGHKDNHDLISTVLRRVNLINEQIDKLPAPPPDGWPIPVFDPDDPDIREKMLTLPHTPMTPWMEAMKTGELCGAKMPRAKNTCGLPLNHRGHHRSARTRRSARQLPGLGR